MSAAAVLLVLALGRRLGRVCGQAILGGAPGESGRHFLEVGVGEAARVVV